MRSRAGAGTSVLLALVLSACGSNGGVTLGSGHSIELAAARTTAARSSRVSLSAVMVISSPQQKTILMSGEGEFDFVRKKGSIGLTITDPRMGQSFQMRALFVGTVFYERFPASVAASLPGGKRWVKFDVEKALARSGLDFSALSNASAGDPSQVLTYLTGVSDDVVTLGTEAVRGSQTTHYRFTVDLNEASERLPPDQRGAYQQLISRLAGPTFPADAWIDAQGIVRKMSITFQFAGGHGFVGSMTETTELYDFGVKVKVAVPADSSVLDFLDLARATATP